MKVCKERPLRVLYKIKDKTKFLTKYCKMSVKISRSPDSMLIFRYTCVNQHRYRFSGQIIINNRVSNISSQISPL